MTWIWINLISSLHNDVNGQKVKSESKKREERGFMRYVKKRAF